MNPRKGTASALGRPWRAPRDHGGPTFTEGRGAWLVDRDGHRVIDATSGALNVLCGHGAGPVVDAYVAQLRALAHVDMSQGLARPGHLLADRLRDVRRGRGERFFFANSGSEAIELAVSVARLYRAADGGGRTDIVTFERGYHGSTALCQSLSGLPQTGRAPASGPRIHHLAFGEFTGEGQRSHRARRHIADRLRSILARSAAGTVLVEPFLNVGGGIRLPAGLLGDIRRVCDEHGALLVLDEVFTGIGRTGAWFAHEHENVRPDLTVFSKGLTNGVCALSAVAVDEHVLERLPAAGVVPYGHTMSASPAACAAAVATLDHMHATDAVAAARDIGARLLRALGRELHGTDGVLDVRGQGLAVSVELDDVGTAETVQQVAYGLGAYTRQQGATVMLAPPACLSRDEADRLADHAVTAVRKAVAAR
ncbi:aminotransferase class III-fold pyridoxal phosphate-dependent enzyme [Yinghuangia sp. ASG 101]|uniref:aminotransferase class III-fold pyridoxal phosphate-dependent enzyme n=1 Tax=Yinghuangia sp. ASG 101 TaxID=2896848 RepID=UPI001E3230C3|nr:aminotransferase class III-fold pyridoxal phosphate-dependent enzyme [Yinghuangia sp. ASG 101]UGQ12162.1 aminotransferase class III-fold pyridoxal phosphate-dependent enzyme [Yinghuangia sp. ASG 101]